MDVTHPTLSLSRRPQTLTLARGMRPAQDARQEQLHIECRAHARPPM